MSKPKVAIAWNSSCGGCDESIVDLEEYLLEAASQVEFVFWPCAMDFKYSDVESYGDGSITVSLINGSIQNSEQERIVRLLRKKSQIVVAFGTCACFGGVPGLANLTNKKSIFNTSFLDSVSVENKEGTLPSIKTEAQGHTLSLPDIFETVYTLDGIIDVDYFLPGCPPTAKMVHLALSALLTGELPEKGSFLLPDKALCSSCSRNESKPDTIKITAFKRIHQIEADPEKCFLDQDVLCMGPATRDGCETPCINGNMPCSGCMGPVGKTADQGARMIGALGGILDAGTETAVPANGEEIPDLAGTFYRYSAPASLLGKKREKD